MIEINRPVEGDHGDDAGNDAGGKTTEITIHTDAHKLSMVESSTFDRHISAQAS